MVRYVPGAQDVVFDQVGLVQRVNKHNAELVNDSMEYWPSFSLYSLSIVMVNVYAAPDLGWYEHLLVHAVLMRLVAKV